MSLCKYCNRPSHPPVAGVICEHPCKNEVRLWEMKWGVGYEVGIKIKQLAMPDETTVKGRIYDIRRFWNGINKSDEYIKKYYLNL